MKPSSNAKSEKELLPERCCIVHRAFNEQVIVLKESPASDLGGGGAGVRGQWRDLVSMSWMCNTDAAIDTVCGKR